jgi:hypothetical protein
MSSMAAPMSVDRDQLAFADASRVRDAVDDLVVDRDAQRVAERREMAGHADEGRDAATRADDPLGQRIELERRDARADRLPDSVESIADEPSSERHLLDLRAALDRHATPSERHRQAARPLMPRQRRRSAVTSSMGWSPWTADSTPASA